MSFLTSAPEPSTCEGHCKCCQILRYQIIVTHLSNVSSCVRNSQVSYGNDGALGTFKRSQTTPLAIGGVVRNSQVSYGNDGALGTFKRSRTAPLAIGDIVRNSHVSYGSALGTFNVFRSSANGDLKLLFWLLEVLSSFMRIEVHLISGRWLVFAISPGKRRNSTCDDMKLQYLYSPCCEGGETSYLNHSSWLAVLLDLWTTCLVLIFIRYQFHVVFYLTF